MANNNNNNNKDIYRNKKNRVRKYINKNKLAHN